MFRIRRIYDDLLPLDRKAIAQVQDILREQFPLLSKEKVDKLPDQLRNPFKYRFRSILFVADGIRGRVQGFALLHHVPDLRFCYLDFISAATYRTGGGIGGALYQRVREEAKALHAVGLFFESLPDDPSLCKDPRILKQNVERLRFYERFGARPIVNYPLPEHVTGEQYRKTLAKALRRIARYKANVLIVALGLDTAKGDPTGTWSLLPKDFRANGRMIGSLRLPTLVIQEGGYRIRTLGTNARYFFSGLWEGMHRFSDPSAKRALGNNKQESEKRGNHQPSNGHVPRRPSAV